MVAGVHTSYSLYILACSVGTSGTKSSMMSPRFLIALATAATLAKAVELPPILDPAPFTSSWQTSTDGFSRKSNIKVPFVNGTGQDDFVNFVRLDLVGSASQRGFAQGELLAQEIVEFIDTALPRWYRYELAQADLSKFPDWLQALLEGALEARAPEIIDRGLDAVWEAEKNFVPPRLAEEMDGIAEGLCAVLGRSAACDVEEWKIKVRRVNMIPELVKMTCSIFGAWGSATPSGKLLQLRALDFGASPFSNYSVLAVNRPEGTAGAFPTPAQLWSYGGALPQAFASLTMPALVGVITGVSERGVGLSEKVWEVYNTSTGVQEGHYDGEADVLVMRDVLELSPNRTSAEQYMRTGVNRTWAVFLGVGDYATQELDIVGYREADFHAYTPDTMPAVTGQPVIPQVVYVDRHPQPSGTDPNDPNNLYLLLQQNYGALTMDTTRGIVQTHDTGDMHIGVYDYGAGKFWFSLGRIDENSEFVIDEWKAHNRPYIEYDLADLWAGK